MAHGKTLELARIQPKDRVRTPKEPSRRRRERADRRAARHTRTGPQRAPRGLAGTLAARRGESWTPDLAVWRTTAVPPWKRRERGRAAARRARLSRRANR
jgi:hypothetical protein